LGQTHQAAARESVEWPLTEPTQSGHWSSAAGNDDLASPLHSLQVLAEAIMQLSDTNFTIGWM
jgi:hypothetical protein